VKTYFRQAALLCSCALVFPVVAAQEQTNEKPIVLETVIGAPKIKVLEAEQESNRRYEKWQEKRLIVFGLVMPSNKHRTFVSRELKKAQLDLRIQANEKKADFDKRWEQLKAELDDIKSSKPKLKTWDISQPVSQGESTFPVQTFHENPKVGYVCYSWFTRTMEMEGVHIGKKTMFKATITTRADGPFMMPLEGGRTFDRETGEIVSPESKK